MPKKTILLVDDGSVILETVKDILKKEGYKIITALSGQEALKKLKRQKIDLALIDVLMPGMSGFDLVEAIRADRKLKNLKIAFLTVLNLSKDQKKGLEKFNISDYIQKPFDPADLIKRVKKIVVQN